MRKKGQFYLIATIIIISIILGFYTLRNYAETGQTYTKVYDLGKELKLETGYVLDYGIYNGNNTNVLIDDWTDKYYNYSQSQGEIEDWIFVYGNETNITATTFTLVSTGEIDIVTGGKKSGVKIEKGRKQKQNIKTEEEHGKMKMVNVTFNNFTYPFELKRGQNFFFVIKSGGSIAQG